MAIDPAISRVTDTDTTRGYSFAYPTVAPSFDNMSYQPLPYADADSTAAMSLDCTACAHQMQLPQRRNLTDRVLGEAPSIDYADFPREIRKSEIHVSEAAARLANKLHLHLD